MMNGAGTRQMWRRARIRAVGRNEPQHLLGLEFWVLVGSERNTTGVGVLLGQHGTERPTLLTSLYQGTRQIRVAADRVDLLDQWWKQRDAPPQTDVAEIFRSH